MLNEILRKGPEIGYFYEEEHEISDGKVLFNSCFLPSFFKGFEEIKAVAFLKHVFSMKIQVSPYASFSPSHLDWE